jgi:hypothetical protein
LQSQLRRVKKFIMTRAARPALAITLVAAALAMLAGCFHSAADEQAAALKKACEEGRIACIKPDDAKLVVGCQAGDAVACQALAVEKCEQGDRHVCQTLAVVKSQLVPLCRSGAAPACKALKIAWPDSSFWKVRRQLADARRDCKGGDTRACQTLALTVQTVGDKVVWVQNYVEPAGKK